jgi:hypothetical protein
VSLREELSERLGAIEAEVVRSGCDAYASAKEIRLALSLAYADECIRQMEWTRRPEREMEVLEVWEGGGRRHPNIVRNLPLTLAPEDWKP